MELSDDDVLEILRLFEQSKFDFLELAQGERKITVSKGGYVAASKAPAASPVVAAVSTSASARPMPSAAPTVRPTAIPDGLVPVPAPMVGKFYASASPSDPPYVLPGSKVEAGATVGLIEVMKVFASIKTETAGTIEKVLVTNGEFVEAGQPLFLIRP